jgi:hypothetical protein
VSHVGYATSYTPADNVPVLHYKGGAIAVSDVSVILYDGHEAISVIIWHH